MNLSDCTEFSGSAHDLAALAIACGKGWALPVDPDKTNERLVRYYVSEGVVDRPDRVGRDAAYGYRHLLQLLTARRMLQAGTALSVIGPHNSTATTKALEEGLAKPLPTAAEMLVNSFLHSKREGTPISTAVPSGGPGATAMPSRPQKTAPPGPSIVDVLAEMRHIRSDWMAELSQVKALHQEIDRLSAGVDRSVSLAQQALSRAESIREDMHHLGAMFEARIAKLGDHLARQNDEMLKKLEELLARPTHYDNEGG